MDLSALCWPSRICSKHPSQRQVPPGKEVWVRQPTRSFQVRKEGGERRALERVSTGPGASPERFLENERNYPDVAPSLDPFGRELQGTKVVLPTQKKRAPSRGRDGNTQEGRGGWVQSAQRSGGDDSPHRPLTAKPGTSPGREPPSARSPRSFPVQHPKRPGVTGKVRRQAQSAWVPLSKPPP